MKVDDPNWPASGSGMVTATHVKTLALPNGRYKFEIAAQEVTGDRWGTWVQGVKVP